MKESVKNECIKNAKNNLLYFFPFSTYVMEIPTFVMITITNVMIYHHSHDDKRSHLIEAPLHV